MGRRRSDCDRKVRYATLEMANDAVTAMADLERADGRLHIWPMSVYRCETHACYHVGHVPYAMLCEMHAPDEVDAILAETDAVSRTDLARRYRPRFDQCEVIVCNRKHTHRCDHTGSQRRDAGGRFVCEFHQHQGRAFRVFTDIEAMALHRKRNAKRRLAISERGVTR